MREDVLRRVVRLVGAGLMFAVLAAQANVRTLDVMAFVAGEHIEPKVLARIDRAASKLTVVET